MAHANYLTYEEYKELGGALAQTDFFRLEFSARKRIDYLTNSRVQGMAEVPEAVKMCVMSLITVESAAGVEAQVLNPVVTSYNTDGYSESYGKAMGAEDAAKSMNVTIRSLLWGETNDEGIEYSSDAAAFVFAQGKVYTSFNDWAPDCTFEVVGNKFDTPELLAQIPQFTPAEFMAQIDKEVCE